jgi:nucleoid-associated protein YgaU
MAIGRYNRTRLIFGNKQFATPEGVVSIRRGIRAGSISTITYVTSDAERLDVIAGRKYGNGRLWWVIAAASGIGWALQVPPGTRLLIPTNLNDIAKIVG